MEKIFNRAKTLYVRIKNQIPIVVVAKLITNWYLFFGHCLVCECWILELRLSDYNLQDVYYSCTNLQRMKQFLMLDVILH